MSLNTGILNDIKSLSRDSFFDGTVVESVLDKFVDTAQEIKPNYTLETGCGKTTLLLSHLSARHLVFSPAGRNAGTIKDNQHLLNESTVEFVIGPSLKNLPHYEFDQQLDLVLLDGAHFFPVPYVEYYYLYPLIRKGGALIIDDIKIPSQYLLFDILRNDQLFQLDEVVAKNTAFFRRTNEDAYNQFQECWPKQNFNKIHHPVDVEKALSGIQYP